MNMMEAQSSEHTHQIIVIKKKGPTTGWDKVPFLRFDSLAMKCEQAKQNLTLMFEILMKENLVCMLMSSIRKYILQ